LRQKPGVEKAADLTHPSVSVVIPNYNGAAFITRTLTAVGVAVRSYPGTAEVVVVDDASTDGSVALIEGSHPDAVLVRHPVNRGFADAVHSGVERAAHDILIILNSDTEPAPDFIAPLVAPLADETVFSTSPLVFDGAGNPLFNSWPRYRLGHGRLVSCRWTLDDVRARQASGRPLNGLYASGGSMAVRRDRFRALGGFLPIYKPYYSEDMDLGTRAWMRGWATRCVPESRVVHPGGGTIKRLFRARRVRTIRIRNQLIYLALYTPRRQLLTRHAPRIALRTLTRLLRFDPTMLSGLVQAIGRRREIAATRAQIAASQPYKTIAEVLEEVAAC
jgi:GT2 family glycosyltransferase